MARSKSQGSGAPKIVRRKAPRRPKSKETRVHGLRRFLPLLGLLAIIGAGATVIMYRQIDILVEQRLSNLNAISSSAIYSEPYMVFSGMKVGAQALRRQLSKRQYVETPMPVAPGEYTLTDSMLRVVTREFLLPNGSIRPVSTIEYHFAEGDVRNETEPQRKDLVLEPLPIAALGSGDIRVATFKQLHELPSYLPKAFLAIEDQRFYLHYGVDPIGILRAVVTNVLSGRVVQGGSTITQQLAKNLFFTSQRSMGRKIKEAFAAISLENHLTKDKILELYLNEVYFGRDGPVAVHGVSEASASYFGRNITEITLSEAALLAGMVKAPSSYAVRRHLNRAVERRNVVLGAMLEEGYISRADYEQALKHQIKPALESVRKRLAPHFTQTVQAELSQSIDIEAAVASGLSIFTGMDREFQACAENAVTVGLEKLEKAHPALKRKNVALEGALVSLEPYSGLVKAWVGGRDYGRNQFNHVSQARRQIGSTIKPFVYLTALSPEFNSYKVATSTSILADEPVGIKVPGSVWTPENYDRKYRGDVTLRYALENSLNVPAVYVSQRVGVEKVVEVLRRFRIVDSLMPVPSIALGAVDATLLNLTAAYGALANGGRYVAPRLYSSVLSANGDISIAVPAQEEKVAEEAPVYLLTNIMQGVVERGTAASIRRAGYSGTVAGKTGTTNDARDAWFVGFTPNLATGVWVGFGDNKKIGLTGGVAAAPIWAEYMKCISPFVEDMAFLPPPGVVFRDVELATYRVVDPACPSRGPTIREVFVRGTEPETTCDPGADLIAPQAPVGEDEYAGSEPLERGEDRTPTLAEEYEMKSRRERGGSFWDRLFN